MTNRYGIDRKLPERVKDMSSFHTHDFESQSEWHALGELIETAMAKGCAVYLQVIGEKGELLVTRVIPHQCDVWVNRIDGQNIRASIQRATFVRFKERKVKK